MGEFWKEVYQEEIFFRRVKKQPFTVAEILRMRLEASVDYENATVEQRRQMREKGLSPNLLNEKILQSREEMYRRWQGRDVRLPRVRERRTSE